MIFDKIGNTKNLQLFASQTTLIIVSALPIVIIDIVFQKYRDRYKSSMLKRNILNIVQIIINILYIYLLMIIYKTMTSHFQLTLPGMFFPGIFFSLQYCMFVDIHNNIKSLIIPI